MASLQSSFIAILFCVLITETISSDEIKLLRNSFAAPIGLVKDSESPRWALAVPHYCEEDDELVGYFYDSSRGEDGPKQIFTPACPPSWSEEYEKEINWKFSAHSSSSVNNKLFFTLGYSMPHFKCPQDAICEPSIQEIQRSDNGDLNCGLSGAQMFGVGYPIATGGVKLSANYRRVPEVQFLPVYTFCFSTTDDTAKLWYTIHHIASPSLLLRNEIREFYEPDLKDGMLSYFDENLRNVETYDREKHYLYNFVGAGDMPTKVWEMTTSFLFNYTSILKNRDSFMGMIKADHYIRLYSRLTNQPLNLYSGVHRTSEMDKDDKTSCSSTLCQPNSTSTSTPVDSFWRVITTIEEKKSIILVTQHSLKKCSKFHVCDKNPIMVKEYEMGGCTYTCSLSSSAIELLGLPEMRYYRADLNLTITRPTEGSELILKDGRGPGSSEPDARYSQRVTDLIEFMNNENFQDAFRVADADIAKNVQN